MELIIVITIFSVLFASVFNVLGDMFGKHSLGTKGYEVLRTLREARINAVAQKNNSAWGVYLNTASDPDSYTLFKGASYAGRDQLYDRLLVFSSPVSFSSISLSGGGSEIVFDKRTGNTSDNGSFSIITDEDQFDITINRLGLADYTY